MAFTTKFNPWTKTLQWISVTSSIAWGAITGIPAAISGTQEAFTTALKNKIDGIVDPLIYKGVINCSANPNYPAASVGHVYKVSVAGKIGGASGVNVEVGDALLCNTATVAGDQATVGSNWNIVQANIDGAVIGPASAVDSNIVEYDGITGKLLKDGSLAHTDVASAVSLKHTQNTDTGTTSDVFQINNDDEGPKIKDEGNRVSFLTYDEGDNVNVEVEDIIAKGNVTDGTNSSSPANIKDAVDKRNKAQTITVAKSGGDYTTISAALTAITDNASDKLYTILIYPGVYDEAITMKQYVDLVGIDRTSCKLTYAASNTLTSANDSSISNLDITNTGTVNIFPINLIHTTNTFEIHNSNIWKTTSGVNAFAISSTNSPLKIYDSDVTVDNSSPSSDYGMALNKIGTCYARNCNFIANNVSGGATGYRACVYFVEGTQIFDNCRIRMDSTSTSYCVQTHTASTVCTLNNCVLEHTNASAGSFCYTDADTTIIQNGCERIGNRSDAGFGTFTYNASKRTSYTATSGATVDEFSTDGTFAGNSDTAVPTEKASKTYADTKLANVAEDTTPELGGELDCGAHSIGFTEQAVTSTSGEVTIDWKLSNKAKLTLSEDITGMTFTNPSKPCNLLLRVIQDSTPRTITWDGDIKWAGGTEPTLTTTSGHVDIMCFYFDGTVYYGSAIQDFTIA